jgi:hypothetical protein
MTELTPQRKELLSHLLPDDTLEYVEEKFPGAVRVALVRRTRAIVKLKLKGYERLKVIYYHLPEPDEFGECPLSVESAHEWWLRPKEPDLWQLATHRACEAMLAVRNGHKEFVQARYKRELSTI